MKSSMLDRITTIILLLICLVLSVVIIARFTGGSSESGMNQPGMQARSNESSVVNVAVQEVNRTTFSRTTTLGGELTSERDAVSITSTLSGKVTEVFVTEGQTVSKGDPIAVIDPSTAGSTYKSTTVTSVMDGTVYQVSAYVGQQATNGTVLATVGKTGELVIETALSERYLATLHTGLEASFTTAAWPNEIQRAVVTHIGSQVQASNRTVKVILSPSVQDDRFKEGMFVSVTLITEKLEDVIVIPSDAITTYLGEPVVYIAEGGTAKRVAVTISVSDDNLSVITSGLSGGEQLITAGSVVEGSRIAVIKEEI